MKKLAAISTLIVLAAAAALPSLAADPRARKAPKPAVDELATEAQPSRRSARRSSAPEDTVSYSGTPPSAAAAGIGPSPIAPACRPSARWSTTCSPSTSAPTAPTTSPAPRTAGTATSSLYVNSFDPTNANSNCVIGNDDGAAGIGELRDLRRRAGRRHPVPAGHHRLRCRRRGHLHQRDRQARAPSPSARSAATSTCRSPRPARCPMSG